MTIEAGEGYVTLIEEWGKTQFNVEKPDGNLVGEGVDRDCGDPETV